MRRPSATGPRATTGGRPRYGERSTARVTLYSRFWTKFLFDLDLTGFDEPFAKT